jgi:hypothetical protein
MNRPPETRSAACARGGAGNPVGADAQSKIEAMASDRADTVRGWQVQRLIAGHALRPDLAAIIAPLAFGEAPR